MYELILFSHILGSSTLVGGVFVLQFMALRAARSSTSGELLDLAHQVSWVGPRLLLPAIALIAASGVGLVRELHYDLGQPFIVIGAVVIGLVCATGPLYVAPAARTMSRLIVASGPDCAQVRRRARGLLAVSVVTSSLLVFAMVCMVIRPI
jgi:uncharacterized membrane protein